MNGKCAISGLLLISAVGCTGGGNKKDPLAANKVAYETYLKEHAPDYDWFANATDAFGGVPEILLRALPDLAPDIWGNADEQFSRFGFLPNPAGAQAPLPLGLSWDSMNTGRAALPFHPVTLTCGSCHIGRVRLDNGSYATLVGAPNTQFDVRKWRRAFELTVHQLLSTPKGIEATADHLRAVIAAKPPNYFYRNFRGITDQDEAGERALYSSRAGGKDVAAAILGGFAQKILLGEVAIAKQKAVSYSKPNAPPLDGGSPGQSDGSGDLIPRLLLLDAINTLGPDKTLHGFMDMTFPALPHELATVTDILSTWQQNTRHVAQIDGSVKSPFFRNVAASLAVAGDPQLVNVLNAEVSARFISALPPPAWPFAIDANKAERGHELFKTNCRICHKPFNDVLYKTDLIGTDPNRSRVLSADALALFLKHFVSSVPENYEIADSNGVKYKPHNLPADAILFDRTQPQNQGYVTNALEGLWARAPYLHNGAVPTLHHLLVPKDRPATFVRGAAGYDRQRVGYQWEAAQLENYRVSDPSAALFNVTWDAASNRGHDTDLTVDANGNILRRGWEGPKRDGELRVRLDWSGAANQEPLADLIEYLKTL